MKKSTIDEIRERFDNDVERFSNLETGQTSTIDAKYNLELITDIAKVLQPNASNVLDIGCGAGNYTIKLLEKIPDLNCTLADLSQLMLRRAHERINSKTKGFIKLLQGDFRKLEFLESEFDIVLAGAVLHHLRDELDWESAFKKLYNLLAPGGCLLVSDLICQDNPFVESYMQEKYGEYLVNLKGTEYRDHVFAYVEKEDSPRSLSYQIFLLKKVGFRYGEILHKNNRFASYCAIK